MDVYEDMKKIAKDRECNVIKRRMATVIMGEFDRVNDGKKIDEVKCIAIIKKSKASLVETKLAYMQRADIDAVADTNIEIEVCDLFLPKMASDEEMLDAVNYVFVNSTFDNKMQAVGVIKKRIESINRMVDGKKLSKIVKEWEI